MGVHDSTLVESLVNITHLAALMALLRSARERAVDTNRLGVLIQPQNANVTMS